ncbi:2OG-Fe(II) oxygenase [Neolewinella aurantiaca]|uniref:2OG-Fe(II) oxygenase n=1 Tax=Neolewinella aurantiaca TaxID=2602767 RepID=A0A5C7FS32_9BACT|nr:alpha-ketoglutarate-dependent dioxygenase AlkB [Neolewinella aurantiaca]TXF90840.1 2OG-Fe(II) oxygenase [Neolewinella aurantiaca]
MLNSEIFTSVSLDPDHVVYTTGFPVQELREYLEFDELWDMHPDEYHTLVMHGKEVKTPRWQQAYGRDYRYSGSRNNAVPITPQLQQFLDWSRANVDERLNGFLLNWYDGAAGHYMGKHRDSRTGLIPDTPIVTISLGEDRIFRFRPWGGQGFKDTLLTDGSALVIPWDTNLAWTHEVPKSKKYTGRRVSVTLRAFS